MANTYSLISSSTLSSSAASVTFSSIPATYTDLIIKLNARSDLAAQLVTTILVTMNGTSTNYSYTYLIANSTSPASGRASSQTSNIALYAAGITATSNTFSSLELYFPSYAGSANKVLSTFGAAETNATNANIATVANLWSNTSAITSIALTSASSSNFIAGSSFYLYGIKNS